MIYKNKDSKNKYLNKNYIFAAVIFIYFIGLIAGCSFVFKNGDNLTFVKKVTLIENIINGETKPISALSTTYVTRSLICIITVLILKYSGILKGMCICIPFILAVQNSAMYSILLYENRFSLFQILYTFMLKDSAVVFIVLIYCGIIINEIVTYKENVKSDIKKLLLYLTAVCIINLIDYTVKAMIFSI